jgi:polysaccharide biosynthesis transport protein
LTYPHRQMPARYEAGSVIDAMPATSAAGGPDPLAGMSVTQFSRIVQAHWRQSLVIWVALTLLAAIVVKFLPKTYTATATLIVDTNNKDPLAGQEFPENLLNSYVATQTELIQSPSVLLSVVDQLHLTNDPEFARGYSGSDPNGLRNYAVHNLVTDMQVDQGRGGQLIYIAVSARYPDKAAILANTISQVYLAQERQRLNTPAGERAQRYSEQLAELRAKVVAAQDRAASYRQEHGIADVMPPANGPPDAADTETQALTTLEQHLLEAQNQRRTLEAKLAGGAPASDEIEASTQIQQLRTQLSTLQEELAQLSATYGPQHPKVTAVKSQIEAARHSLEEETRTLNTDALTSLTRAKALEDKYAKAVADQEAVVLKIRDAQGQGGKIELELESAQSVYKRALDGYDQIMFASVGNYTNVSVVSQATPPEKSTKPNKIELMLLAMVAAAGAGVGVPFLYELLLNRRLRCRDDIERSLGIPVLAHFDAIPSTTGAA